MSANPNANPNANINSMVNAAALNTAIKAIKAKNASSQSEDDKRRLPKLEAKLTGLPKSNGANPVPAASGPPAAAKSVSVTSLRNATANNESAGAPKGSKIFAALGGRRKRTRRAKKTKRSKRTRRHR